jgi:DNA-binding XRE family transcriptional regulator
MRKKAKVILRLRQLRRAREMTQEALGRRVGLNRASICSIEKGTRRPSLEKAQAIAAEFGVSIEEIFADVEVPA